MVTIVPSTTVIELSSARAPGIALSDAVDLTVAEHYAKTTRHKQAYWQGQALKQTYGHLYLHQLDEEWLEKYRDACLASGNATSTTNIKLNFVSVMLKLHKRHLIKADPNFRHPQVPWVRKKGRREIADLKWWLQPELEEKMVKWLAQEEPLAADYILFITHSGLRVEEALRLQRKHFNFVRGELTILGTKSVKAHRTIPLWSTAKDIALKHLANAPDDAFLFDFADCVEELGGNLDRIEFRNYRHLREIWNRLRDVFGLHQTKTATLKALRRSFARRATDAGMPTAILREYLGHEDIQTTIGYLALVGDNTNVMRQWVK